MSSYLEPCRHQPPDFCRLDHLDTIEGLRRTEMLLAETRDLVWLDLDRLADNPMGLYGRDDESAVREAREWTEHKRGEIRGLTYALKRIFRVLCNFYDYPEEYRDIIFHAGKYTERLPAQGHGYDGFWGVGREDCPEKQGGPPWHLKKEGSK